MPITPEITKFLENSGYKNHCFVSYAYTGENQAAEFAQRIQAEIETELKTQVPKPRVFLNTIHIPPGNPWPEEIRDNLAGSLTMVAILSQIYFTEQHPWCGIEWTAMDHLRRSRFPENGVYPVVPVLYRKPVLPKGVELRQYIDLTRNQIAGRRYYAFQEFKEAIAKIIRKIEEVAEAAYCQKCKALAANFEWSEVSLVPGSGQQFVVAEQHFPFGPRIKKKMKKGQGS